MKTQKRIFKVIIGLFLSGLMIFFSGCNKDNDNRVVVGQRPDIQANQNCTNCPINTNHLTDAIGSAGPGIFEAELGMGLYTPADQVNNGNVVGQPVTVAGYLFVDRDNNTYCFLREGHYALETVEAGQLASTQIVQGLKIRAIHQGTGEVVYIGFPWGLAYNSLVPERISPIDGVHYGHWLNGWAQIERIEGPQINCNSGATYLFGKPY